MSYVQRDASRKIIGIFANKQPGVAEEVLSDDLPEIKDYLSPVPGVISMAQARQALLDAGLLARANSMIMEMPGLNGESARIWWEYSTEVHRDAALVLAVATSLGLTMAQVDGLFRSAAAIKAEKAAP